jgi:hypothetical protein
VRLIDLREFHQEGMLDFCGIKHSRPRQLIADSEAMIFEPLVEEVGVEGRLGVMPAQP